MSGPDVARLKQSSFTKPNFIYQAEELVIPKRMQSCSTVHASPPPAHIQVICAGLSHEQIILKKRKGVHGCVYI